MDLAISDLFEGAFIYLEMRNWASEKIKLISAKTAITDCNIYHYVYFSNLHGLLDLVDEYLCKNKNIKNFKETAIDAFGPGEEFSYSRQIRNGLIHRGTKISKYGFHSEGLDYVLMPDLPNDQPVKFRCPNEVRDEKGKNIYKTKFEFTCDLVDFCNNVSRSLLNKTFEDHNIFAPENIFPSPEQTREFMKPMTSVPDWREKFTPEKFTSIDWDSAIKNMAIEKINQLKSLINFPNK